MSPIVVAPGVRLERRRAWTARSCSRRRRSATGTPAVAVVAAEHALEEALRTGLPTVWRAQRAAAEAYRAAGDEKRATEHAAEAERARLRRVVARDP